MGMSDYVLDQEMKAFELWQAAVDVICKDTIGVDAESLTDYCWAEAHADGLSPREAFDEMYAAYYGETWGAHNGQFGLGA